MLDDLARTHHAALLTACWRECGTLAVRKPKITGVFGVEDFDHPRNKCGMLEATCVGGNGQLIELTGATMLPLVHGYHRDGPNGAVDGAAPSYAIKTPSIRTKGVGMADLSLIRLPPPALDGHLVRLIAAQPLAIGSMIGTLALSVAVASSALSGIMRVFVTRTLAVLLTAHAAEGLLALAISVNQLKLPLGAACEWAVLVAAIGWPATRWLLRLRQP